MMLERGVRREQTRRPRAMVVVLGASLMVRGSGHAVPSVTGVPAGCDWPVTIGYDGVNAMAPDTQAAYWALAYESVPGGRLRIDGQFPEARYFSLTVQDAIAITLGSLRDDDLQPDPDSANPFQGPTRPSAGRDYTAWLDFSPPPDGDGAPNTLYVGETFEGEPNPGGTLLYRVYVPTDQDDPQGGVALPDVSLEVAGRSIDLELEQCQPLPPALGGPGNELTSDASRPDVLPNPEPENRDYHRTPNFVPLREAYFTEPVVNALPDPLADAVPRRRGIPLANVDFPYLSANITRAYGELVVIRMKAPSFPDTVRGEPAWRRTQTRYWSLCNYAAIEEGLLRGTGCLTDFLTEPGPDDYVRVVVSDPARRPDAVVNPARGVHWLPWGPYNRDYLLYRMGVPDPRWQHAPGQIPADADDQAAAAQEVMGEYYPVARYCTEAVILDAGIDACFEWAGWRP